MIWEHYIACLQECKPSLLRGFTERQLKKRWRSAAGEKLKTRRGTLSSSVKFTPSIKPVQLSKKQPKIQREGWTVKKNKIKKKIEKSNASKLHAELDGMLTNMAGSIEEKMRLKVGVIKLILLYGAKIWAGALNTKVNVSPRCNGTDALRVAISRYLPWRLWLSWGLCSKWHAWKRQRLIVWSLILCPGY